MLKARYGRPGPELWFNKPDPDDELTVDWDEGKEGTIFDDPENVELEEADDAKSMQAPTVPDAIEDEDLTVEFDDDVDDEDLGKAPRATKEEDDGDEFEDVDVEVDEAFRSTMVSQQTQQRINQAEASAVWTQAQARASEIRQQLNQAQMGFDGLQNKRSQFQQALQEAYQEDDAVLAMRIQNELQSIDRIENELNHAVNQLDDPDAIIEQGRNQAQRILNRRPQGNLVGQGISTTNPTASRWAKANAEWMSSNRQANQFVIHQGQQMVSSGWDPGTPGFYAEMAKRVKSAFPQLNVKAISAKGAGGKKPARAQVRTAATPARTRSATPSRPARSGHQGGNRYSLSKGDIAAMRRSNLDPGNAKHRAAFAKSRMEHQGA